MPQGKRGGHYVLRTRKHRTKGGAKGTRYRDYSKNPKRKKRKSKR